jgi:hypothetical protein
MYRCTLAQGPPEILNQRPRDGELAATTLDHRGLLASVVGVRRLKDEAIDDRWLDVLVGAGKTHGEKLCGAINTSIHQGVSHGRTVIGHLAR